jgi:hypothetical protein
VPIAAIFNTPHELHTVSGGIDFAVAVILWADIVVRFHAPVYLTSAYKAVTLNHPRAVAHWYVFNGSFLFDVLVATPLLVLPFVATNRKVMFAVLVLRILRLRRVKRIIDMLYYVQMLSVSGTSAATMIVGSVVSILYRIFVMVNLLACFWYWVGTQSLPHTGWLAQEYSVFLATILP